MNINVENLKKELLKEEIIDKIELNILERTSIYTLKKWNKLDWVNDIIATLGFSLSNIVVDFLELNKGFFENKTDYKWEAYVDEVLNSFVNGKYIDPFKCIECEPFFNTIEEFAKVLKDRIVDSDNIIECPYCECNLKDTGFYSKQQPMFLFNDDKDRFELMPVLADENFEVYCCSCDNKLDSSKYLISE